MVIFRLNAFKRIFLYSNSKLHFCTNSLLPQAVPFSRRIFVVWFTVGTVLFLSLCTGGTDCSYDSYKEWERGHRDWTIAEWETRQGFYKCSGKGNLSCSPPLSLFLTPFFSPSLFLPPSPSLTLSHLSLPCLHIPLPPALFFSLSLSLSLPSNTPTTPVSQTTGWSALFFASKEGHLEIAKALIKSGANTMLRDKVNHASIDLKTKS